MYVYFLNSIILSNCIKLPLGILLDNSTYSIFTHYLYLHALYAPSLLQCTLFSELSLFAQNTSFFVAALIRKLKLLSNKDVR